MDRAVLRWTVVRKAVVFVVDNVIVGVVFVEKSKTKKKTSLQKITELEE
jgi:hypothetical protein